MKRWFSLPLVQIALYVGAYALLGYRFGVFAFLIASPVFATLMKRPLFDLLADFRRRVREHVWLPVHGHHYVFKGMTIHVLEDDDHCRWISLADVRKVLGVTATERALAHTYPGRLQSMGEAAETHIRDDALVTHLSKENQATALRFRTWVERNIALPGRTIRKRLGIRSDNE